MKINILKLFILYFTISIINILSTYSNATILPSSSEWTNSYISNKFPEDYSYLINELKLKHPNWIFKAIYTNLNWDTIIYHQSNNYLSGINTIHDSYSSNWKYNSRNEYADGSFVKASDTAIAYTLDPRNSLTEERIFQFEYLGYSSNAHTEEAVKAVLSGTLMGETKKNQYKIYGGTWVNLGTTYSKLILNIGKSQGINPVHMASRIRQETSCDLANNASINGQHYIYKSKYNFFNIKATPDANGNNAVTNGLKYAASQNWINPNNSISGGTSTIRKYINNDQNTIYFEKFPTNNEGRATKLLGTGYMTNIMAPINESKTTYNAYKKTGILESSFEFHIPIYNNMPDICPNPNIISEYKDDDTRIYLDGSKNNTYYLKNSDGNSILSITEDATSQQSSTPSYVTYRKRKYTYNASDYVEIYVVKTGKTYTGFIEKKYINDFPQDKLDKISPILNISYEYDEISNTIIAKITSNEILKDTKPTWQLSEDKKSYTKVFDKNQIYSTPVSDLSKNITNVTIEISQIDDIPPNISFEYILNDDNSVTVMATSNEELKNNKPTWTLSKNKLLYSKNFNKNQKYYTTFSDKYGNVKNYLVEFYLIKMDVDITYTYDEINNIAIAYVYNKDGFQNTKPTWTLSNDKKTYSKSFNMNQNYKTQFVDLTDNIDMLEININSIDDMPPNITFDYILNDDNSVTVTAISNEELKSNKPTWTLSDDNFIYSKTFNKNQNYTTKFTDKFGNSKNYNIYFDHIRINYSIEYEYNELNNIVTAKIISTTQLQNTKPTWTLDKNNLIYTKIFDTNQDYTTPITDIYGNVEYVKINFDLIK